MSMQSIAEAIKALRARRGMSQVQLAAELGWARGTIAAIEAGHARPGAELVEALATFFQVSTDTILGRQGNPTLAQATSDEEAELLSRFREAPANVKAALLAAARAMTNSSN